GLRAIKDEGGITIAQDEQSAKYYDLPRSAVAAGCVDLVLRPEDIAQELVKLSRHPYVPYLETEGAENLLPQSDLEKIFGLLRKATKVDFADYKHATIKRRILRRMLILKKEKMEDYLKYLQTNPGELSSLFQDILISVTGFFREPETFEALKHEIFPSILKNRSADDAIRVWVPGCSTGEEVYSLAICLVEYLDRSRVHPSIQIFATDVNEAVLEKARQGVYAASASISAERLQRFFVPTNGSIQVSKPIRRMCVFAKQDVTADPPFSKLDLIVCRNLLIYLGSSLQRKLLPIFHYSLKPTGFLVLGDFETVGEFDNIFKLANKRLKIYSKKPVDTRTPLDFSSRYIAARDEQVDEPGASRQAESRAPEQEIFKEADRILLTRYSPASAIVNGDLEIVQFRGRTGAFLEPAPGKASLNILKMARQGLMTDLRLALDKAKKSGETVRRDAIEIRSDGKYLDVNLEVVPLKTHTGYPCFLVAFEEALPNPAPSVSRGRVRGEKSGKERRTEDLKIVRLQQELSATKDYLQSIIEDKEAANEELKAANEELQNRNLELTQAHNDMTNLNAGANVPILMTGSDLRLRSWGPLSEKLFNLKASDLGRSIFDINLDLQTPDLKGTIEEVVAQDVDKELEVRGPHGRWFLVRIRPYRTADNKIEGAVLAFVDIDRIKQVEEELRARSGHLEDLVEERTRMLSNTTRMAAIGETAGMVGHDLRNPLQTIINT
ncbi:ATPase, partial [Candidatus Bathyarchaeota archaeon]